MKCLFRIVHACAVLRGARRPSDHSCARRKYFNASYLQLRSFLAEQVVHARNGVRPSAVVEGRLERLRRRLGVRRRWLSQQGLCATAVP